ncbi:NAD-dependent epimerase/dehydratase family protein [Mucilaginibacter agri]|uniref:NAD-dependent epimerase/dehydratase family protein n=1 Tax=Mucilaginibacter agri TaxID=2695265 RepID=A0A965ZJM3_9SPHI|nr:NAD(P)-dependent oxidoreductase [Mucilaginibacter agri]NCD72378.1 NAD-dependent epimerase/dehydratase family protein [Mucilaginibacter agri]
MKSIVIGGSGFLGTAVCNELLKRGDEVISFDRGLRTKIASPEIYADKFTFIEGNIMDRPALPPVFEGADEIYHLAGQLGTSELESAMRGAIEVNIIGSLNVFETAIACKVPRLFLASKPNVWLNTYTITKHTAEKIANLLTRYNPIRISVLKYFNLFGPGQKVYPVRKILPTFAIQAMNGLPIQVFGDGQQTVDMLFVNDAAKITVDVTRAEYNPNTMDCGTGIEMTVLEVAEAVNRYFNNSAGVISMPMRIGETPNTRLVANRAALEKAIGKIEFTPFEEALNRSLAYYERMDPHDANAALNFYGFSQPFSMAW